MDGFVDGMGAPGRRPILQGVDRQRAIEPIHRGNAGSRNINALRASHVAIHSVAFPSTYDTRPLDTQGQAVVAGSGGDTAAPNRVDAMLKAAQEVRGRLARTMLTASQLHSRRSGKEELHARRRTPASAHTSTPIATSPSQSNRDMCNDTMRHRATDPTINATTTTTSENGMTNNHMNHHDSNPAARYHRRASADVRRTHSGRSSVGHRASRSPRRDVRPGVATDVEEKESSHPHGQRLLSRSASSRLRRSYSHLPSSYGHLCHHPDMHYPYSPDHHTPAHQHHRDRDDPRAFYPLPRSRHSRYRSVRARSRDSYVRANDDSDASTLSERGSNREDRHTRDSLHYPYQPSRYRVPAHSPARRRSGCTHESDAESYNHSYVNRRHGSLSRSRASHRAARHLDSLSARHREPITTASLTNDDFDTGDDNKHGHDSILHSGGRYHAPHTRATSNFMHRTAHVLARDDVESPGVEPLSATLGVTSQTPGHRRRQSNDEGTLCRRSQRRRRRRRVRRLSREVSESVEVFTRPTKEAEEVIHPNTAAAAPMNAFVRVRLHRCVNALGTNSDAASHDSVSHNKSIMSMMSEYVVVLRTPRERGYSSVRGASACMTFNDEFLFMREENGAQSLSCTLVGVTSASTRADTGDTTANHSTSHDAQSAVPASTLVRRKRIAECVVSLHTPNRAHDEECLTVPLVRHAGTQQAYECGEVVLSLLLMAGTSNSSSTATSTDHRVRNMLAVSPEMDYFTDRVHALLQRCQPQRLHHWRWLVDYYAVRSREERRRLLEQLGQMSRSGNEAVRGRTNNNSNSTDHHNASTSVDASATAISEKKRATAAAATSVHGDTTAHYSNSAHPMTSSSVGRAAVAAAGCTPSPSSSTPAARVTPREVCVELTLAEVSELTDELGRPAAVGKCFVAVTAEVASAVSDTSSSHAVFAEQSSRSVHHTWYSSAVTYSRSRASWQQGSVGTNTSGLPDPASSRNDFTAASATNTYTTPVDVPQVLCPDKAIRCVFPVSVSVLTVTLYCVPRNELASLSFLSSFGACPAPFAMLPLNNNKSSNPNPNNNNSCSYSNSSCSSCSNGTMYSEFVVGTAQLSTAAVLVHPLDAQTARESDWIDAVVVRNAGTSEATVAGQVRLSMRRVGHASCHDTSASASTTLSSTSSAATLRVLRGCVLAHLWRLHRAALHRWHVILTQMLLLHHQRCALAGTAVSVRACMQSWFHDDPDVEVLASCRVRRVVLSCAASESVSTPLAQSSSSTGVNASTAHTTSPLSWAQREVACHMRLRCGPHQSRISAPLPFACVVQENGELAMRVRSSSAGSVRNRHGRLTDTNHSENDMRVMNSIGNSIAASSSASAMAGGAGASAKDATRAVASGVVMTYAPFSDPMECVLVAEMPRGEDVEVGRVSVGARSLFQQQQQQQQQQQHHREQDEQPCRTWREVSFITHALTPSARRWSGKVDLHLTMFPPNASASLSAAAPSIVIPPLSCGREGADGDGKAHRTSTTIHPPHDPEQHYLDLLERFLECRDPARAHLVRFVLDQHPTRHPREVLEKVMRAYGADVASAPMTLRVVGLMDLQRARRRSGGYTVAGGDHNYYAKTRRSKGAEVEDDRYGAEGWCHVQILHHRVDPSFDPLLSWLSVDAAADRDEDRSYLAWHSSRRRRPSPMAQTASLYSSLDAGTSRMSSTGDAPPPTAQHQQGGASGAHAPYSGRGRSPSAWNHTRASYVPVAHASFAMTTPTAASSHTTKALPSSLSTSHVHDPAAPPSGQPQLLLRTRDVSDAAAVAWMDMTHNNEITTTLRDARTTMLTVRLCEREHGLWKKGGTSSRRKRTSHGNPNSPGTSMTSHGIRGSAELALDLFARAEVNTLWLPLFAPGDAAEATRVRSWYTTGATFSRASTSSAAAMAFDYRYRASRSAQEAAMPVCFVGLELQSLAFTHTCSYAPSSAAARMQTRIMMRMCGGRSGGTDALPIPLPLPLLDANRVAWHATSQLASDGGRVRSTRGETDTRGERSEAVGSGGRSSLGGHGAPSLATAPLAFAAASPAHSLLTRVVVDVMTLFAKYAPQALPYIQPCIAQCASLHTAHRTLRDRLTGRRVDWTVYVHIDGVDVCHHHHHHHHNNNNTTPLVAKTVPSSLAASSSSCLLSQEFCGALVVQLSMAHEQLQSCKRADFVNDVIHRRVYYPVMRVDLPSPHRLDLTPIGPSLTDDMSSYNNNSSEPTNHKDDANTTNSDSADRIPNNSSKTTNDPSSSMSALHPSRSAALNGHDSRSGRSTTSPSMRRVRMSEGDAVIERSIGRSCRTATTPASTPSRASVSSATQQQQQHNSCALPALELKLMGVSHGAIPASLSHSSSSVCGRTGTKDITSAAVNATFSPFPSKTADHSAGRLPPFMLGEIGSVQLSMRALLTASLYTPGAVVRVPILRSNITRGSNTMISSSSGGGGDITDVGDDCDEIVAMVRLRLTQPCFQSYTAESSVPSRQSSVDSSDAAFSAAGHALPPWMRLGDAVQQRLLTRSDCVAFVRYYETHIAEEMRRRCPAQLRTFYYEFYERHVASGVWAVSLPRWLSRVQSLPELRSETGTSTSRMGQTHAVARPPQLPSQIIDYARARLRE